MKNYGNGIYVQLESKIYTNLFQLLSIMTSNNSLNTDAYTAPVSSNVEVF
jgi:hypothetical protein